ncbi:L,D-transpeptidase family protein [Aliiroseovarius sediminis]|uniref:L,D-transpeptidase family protein n=1 Tax=Aliiroseovarius sediminis TaxID=2925839 RepID=UPI001F58F01D|nr:L,D-transpeptidase family protein [Aliiroseovarius sediminis]MCI2393190.1 L,D-transpeptidase family protein [Aliiroseovarius sediminis]
MRIQTHTQLDGLTSGISVSAFAQAIAEAAAQNEEIAAYYRSTGFQPIWTDNDEASTARRSALFRAMKRAPDHGLPDYDTAAVMRQLEGVASLRDLGRLEVAMSQLFVAYAQDINSGVLTPSKVDSGIVRKVPRKSGTTLLTALADADPHHYFKTLPPKAPEYARLMKEKLKLEGLMANGGWGPTVPAKSLKPGQSGAAVVALRNRLIRMGYLNRSASQSYDAAIQTAVQLFQQDHGLTADGVAGASTMAQINQSLQNRLGSIVVAMERERWTNFDRGDRHVWVNLTDFSAELVDHGRVTFATRSVIGKNQHDLRSPEFSDVMEFMVVNPTWNVPRSIATKEYLPMLKRNPNAVSHLKLIDSRGRVVNRSRVNFKAFSAKSFPFAIKQPPSKRNALGLVKFMFPNKYNIYLHDTPSKSLFGREVRAFSHGCIRLSDPFDFAYELLSKQTADPEGKFHSVLNTGRETRIDLDQPVPVHLVYRTAIAPVKGRVNYRRDIYGRDAKLWQALQNAGVALRGAEG